MGCRRSSSAGARRCTMTTTEGALAVRCGGVLSRAKDASLSKIGANVGERDAIAVAKDASLASMRAKDSSLAYKRAKDASLVARIPIFGIALRVRKTHLEHGVFGPTGGVRDSRPMGCLVQLAGCGTPRPMSLAGRAIWCGASR